MQPQNDAYAYIHTLDRMVIVHLLRPPDLYEDGPILSKYTLPAFRGTYFFFFLHLKRHFGPYFGVYAMVWYLSLFFIKRKKFVKLTISLYFFFKNRQKLVKVKIGLSFTTLKPYLVTNLQENLILERKLVILSRRRKRKIKQ